MSSPPQSPVTTSDEPSTKPPRTDKSPEHTTPYPDQFLASPVTFQTALDTNTSKSTVQSRIQTNAASQKSSTAPILIDSTLSCLTLSGQAMSLRHDQPAKRLSQPHNSGSIDPVSVSLEPRQSITPSFSFPGASKPTTTYGPAFPDSADFNPTLTTISSTESISTTSERMPNVYINGLPPNYSEQELFALTRPFGDIKSVRTFTRHVSEKPTGYGFVLYYDVESAQRCIEGLRKYRNLHPSFSKQVHRIPGTEYAQHDCAQSIDQDENTFKSRMDKLKDNASTNLYIEGLPLSTDDESLTALMSPYKIKSSRFFKTKLSNPPRIIAFVRLESRTAAEEIIERLHGRMVRGWNDPGCRISVRFADSTEQRELRRAERTLKNGDQSPSRLTIAQAALLNLRGQEYQANIRDVSCGEPQRVADPRLDAQVATFTPNSEPGMPTTSRSLPYRLRYPRESPLSSITELPVISEMDNLLQSIQDLGYDDGSFDNEGLISQEAQLRMLASASLVSPNLPPVTLPRGHTQARNGFTAAEELIFEAHAQHLQLQTHPSRSSLVEPTPPLKRFSSSIRSLDHASHARPHVALSGKTMFSQEALPTISEDDFHAMGHPPQRFMPTSHGFKGLVGGCPPNASTAASTLFVRPPNRAVSIVAPPPDYEEPGKRQKGHQHTERASRRSHPSSDSKSRSSLIQASIPANDISNSNINNSNTITIPCDPNEFQHTYMYSHGDGQGHSQQDKASRIRISPVTQLYSKKSPQLGGEQHSNGPNSPAVASPALTYSSRTPSTLSPATPFFGSFAGSQDVFEVMPTESEEMAERKLKANVAGK